MWRLGKQIKKNSGMMTVEAAVIVPIVISVTILLVWLGIYYYDKNLLSDVAAEAAVYGSKHSEYSNGELVNMVEDRAYECIKDRNVLLENVEIQVNVSFSEIIVEMRGRLNVPSGILFGDIYKENTWVIMTIKRAPRLNNAEFVRMLHLLKSK